jgi:hypothetical protein
VRHYGENTGKLILKKIVSVMIKLLIFVFASVELEGDLKLIRWNSLNCRSAVKSAYVDVAG